MVLTSLKKKKKDSLSSKPLMSLLLFLGSSFDLKPGQLQGFQACRLHPNLNEGT